MEKHKCKEFIYRNGDYRQTACGKTAKFDVVDSVPTKCGFHCTASKEKRRAKYESRYKAFRELSDAKYSVSKVSFELEPLMRRIAAGHNDPRGAAQDLIARLDEARSKLST